MAHLRTKIGEYAIILNSKREFLMLEFNTLPDTWHFPGGRLDEEDESVFGLIREVKEETNLDIYDIKPVHTQIFSEERKYGVFFIAKAKEPYHIKLSDEHKSYKWFKKNDKDKIHFWQPFYKKLIEDRLRYNKK